MRDWIPNFRGLLNLFLEPDCPLCQRPTAQEFCQDCTKQLQRCQLRQPNQWQELPVVAWGVYGGTLKRAIAALKYENQPQLARPLGHWLAQTWLKLHADGNNCKIPPVVVPIPLHTDRQKQRGYNQAELLAQSFCNTTKLQLQPLGLERLRATEAQFSLSAKAREKNLEMAFELGSGFRRRQPVSPVLLLDDIYTTGATARSAAQALQRSGIKVCGLVAVATTLKAE